MPVHPEAEQLLAAIAEAGLPPTEELTVLEAAWAGATSVRP